MNINKQLTKGNKMKKIAMIIGVLTVLATSANATGWGSGSSIWTKPNYSGGYNFYSENSFLGYSKPNYSGGYNFYYK